ncbi:MAG: c-type cytochrome [Chitinophagaceae bacterium]|nr:c-type cytochrome [Chitinophagaceae bacterium]MCW5927686.1 c-type cytochrome [Chitinophagaceae bacterium]
MGVILAFVAVPFSFKPDHVSPLQQRIPEGFPPPVYDYKNNPLTKEGFELGKRLFYDGRLSSDGQTACASCHQQFAAFSDFEHVFSHGVDNRFTLRNAPPLFNLAWHKEFHADGAINHIEWQPLSPLTGDNEMGTTIEKAINMLQDDPFYAVMFKKAFGDTAVTSQRMLHALAQFTGYIVSADSKYDRVLKKQDRFTEWEENGYRIFQQRCASCHTEPLFTDLKYHNIGLALDTFLNDFGRMTITGESRDSLAFKTPTLRNITRTEPYMHDGRFWGLSTAIDHWRTYSVSDSSAHELIRNGTPLEKIEIKYLISFLHTLVDSTLLSDPMLADPIPGNRIHQPVLGH